MKPILFWCDVDYLPDMIVAIKFVLYDNFKELVFYHYVVSCVKYHAYSCWWNQQPNGKTKIPQAVTYFYPLQKTIEKNSCIKSLSQLNMLNTKKLYAQI